MVDLGEVQNAYNIKLRDDEALTSAPCLPAS
jgi:hypothetical protein